MTRSFANDDKNLGRVLPEETHGKISTFRFLNHNIYFLVPLTAQI